MKTRDVVIIGLALVLSAFILGRFFYESRSRDSITVVGNATKRFDTDIVKWQMTVVRSVQGSNVSDAYPLVSHDTGKIVEELVAKGIDRKNISVQPVVSMPMYDREGAVSGYRVQQSLTIITDKVDTIDAMALNPEAVTSKGVIVENSQLEYFYSKVDELKRSLLGDAAKDARMRADEIAGGSGVEVGAIRSARAGVFQITEPYSTEVSGFGVYNTTSRVKDIKVTVHVEFELD